MNSQESRELLQNNKVQIAGTIVSGFTFSHKAYGEGFYGMDVSVKRLSGNTDIIPVIISDRLIDISQDYQGEAIQVTGQFRSCNRHDASGNHLILFVFAREANFIEEWDDGLITNEVFLDGHICREARYRATPLGREIADVLLAVNRPYNKSDYIPCICWGRNALFADSLDVGAHIQLTGRIQSRQYVKKLDDGAVETRTAWEVSVGKLEVVDWINKY